MGIRRKSRELALQILFQSEFERDLNSESSMALYRESFDSTPELWEYAKRVVKGVFESKQKIDDIIQAHSSHWKIDRMSIVDRNILRLATFEMMFMTEEVPRNVAINEAIEVSKKFGSADSGSFVNGILDNIARSF